QWAAIQDRDLTEADISGLFWLNLKLNLAVLVFMAAMAPVLAWFYDEPALTAVTMATAIGFMVHGVSYQHQSLLKRRMRFGSFTGVEVGSQAVGAAAGISGALAGFGYWALVAQALAIAFVTAGGMWWVSGWRPLAPGESSVPTDIGRLLNYGKYTTAYRVLTHLGGNLDNILVGYLLGARQVGLYSKAYKWAHMPVTQIYNPLMAVAVSSFSRVSDDPERYRRFVRRGLLPIFAIPLPALAFLFVEAERSILLLLGDQWLAAVPYFRILCVGAALGSLDKVMKWLYLSEGNTRRQFRWGLVKTPVLILGVSLGVRWGALGVAVGYAAANALLALPAVAYCTAGSLLRFSDVLRTLWRPVAGAVVAAAGLASLEPLLPDSGLVGAVLIRLASFALLYLGTWIALPGGLDDLREIVTRLRIGMVGDRMENSE
ncbi:MAG: lipopolysaccharide biosynthesis protein, partial [Gemmatimonadota bacterium]